MGERGFDYGFKVLVYGDNDSGKDCFLNRFVRGEFPGKKADCEDLVIKQIVIHGKRVRLFLINMSIFSKNLCKKNNPKLERIYESSADVIVICVDPTQSTLFTNLHRRLKTAQLSKNKLQKVVIAMTKLDDVSSHLPKSVALPTVLEKAEKHNDPNALLSSLPDALLHNILLTVSLTTIRDLMTLNSLWFRIMNNNDFWAKLCLAWFPAKIYDQNADFKDQFHTYFFASQWPYLTDCKNWADTMSIPYFETSAKINKGIDSLFAEVIQPLVEQRIQESPQIATINKQAGTPSDENEQTSEESNQIKLQQNPKKPENKKRQAAIYECPATTLYRNFFKKQIDAQGLLLIVDNWLYMQQSVSPFKSIVELDIRKIERISQATEAEVLEKTGFTTPPSVHNSPCSAAIIFFKKSNQKPLVIFIPPTEVAALLVEMANKLV